MRICSGLKNMRLAGFYTEEIRHNDTRRGFRWKRLDGIEGVLAHVDIKGKYRVGRYGVDVAGFERDVVGVLDAERRESQLFVIDEIGKMECLSQKFVDVVGWLFACDKPVLATVARKGAGLITEVKTWPGISLITLTEKTRDSVIDEIIKILHVSQYGKE